MLLRLIVSIIPIDMKPNMYTLGGVQHQASTVSYLHEIGGNLIYMEPEIGSLSKRERHNPIGRGLSKTGANGIRELVFYGNELES